MLHHQPVVHSSHQPYYHQSSENITPERLKLKQLKHRVATPKPVIHPFFLSSHEQQHAPPPPFNHDFVPFVKYPPEYMEPYQTEPYTISTPNKDQNYYYVNHQPPQPFDIHPHHFEQHLDHHEMIIQPSNPPQSFNHQQLRWHYCSVFTKFLLKKYKSKISHLLCFALLLSFVAIIITQIANGFTSTTPFPVQVHGLFSSLMVDFFFGINNC